MPNKEMPNIDILQDLVGKLETIDEFIHLIIDEFNIPADDVNLTAIDIFTLEEAEVVIDENNKNYVFTVGVTIAIDQDENGAATQELSGRLNIEMQPQDNSNYTGIYGGSLIIPVSDADNLTFDLHYETKTESSKTTKLVIGQLNVQQEEDIGNVSLAQLVGEICPGLSPLFPEELVDSFNLQENVLFAIYSTPKSAGNQQRMLFSIGFNANISFSSIPLLGNFLPPDLLNSEFAFEFLVSFQAFNQQELITLNSLLESLESPLRIKPPSSSINKLERGASIGAHFNIGGYEQAWLLTLKNTSKTSGGSRSLTTRSTPEDTSTATSDEIITIADNGVWLMVQKSFGPMHFQKVGLVYKQGEIHLTPQFTIEVSRLLLSISALSISTPLTHFKTKFNLDGFGLELISKGLEISGAFLRVENDDYEEYLGTATVGFTKGKGGKSAISLSAIGSFADYKNSGNFSLFLYVAADFPFGGPPFFFVTGVSAGFGYNRDLIVPPLEEIATFPLVAQAIEGVAPIDSEDIGGTVSEQLELLEEYIPPLTSAGFGAIGLKFTCFKVIDGFGLVTFAISQTDFELNLLGIGSLSLPTTIGNKEPIAMAEVAIQARFNPLEGVLMLRGQLTPNSYIFSRDCVLTGGFAYGFWFMPPRVGDFVFTQGGYHPRFQARDLYPDVPRLGMDWQIDNHSHTTAQVYFALCGHGVMAGGLLDICYSAGNIWASFGVGADFLLAWAPYHYDISLHAHIAAGMGTISVGLGLDIHFWGPDFGCKFKFKILLVKITIEIGDQSSVYSDPIAWDEFQKTFLPQEEDVCSITAIDGLVKQFLLGEDGEEQQEIWAINPTTFELSTDSLIPAKQAFNGSSEFSLETNTDFGINSMGISKDNLNTTHKVTILKDLTAGTQENAEEKFKFEPIPKLASTATWGEPNMSNGRIKPPEVNQEEFVEDVFYGFRILPADPPHAGKTHEIGVEHLQYETVPIDDSYLWESLQSFVENLDYDTEQEKRNCIKDTIASNEQRDDILSALGLDLNEVNIEDSEIVANSFILTPLVK